MPESARKPEARTQELTLLTAFGLVAVAVGLFDDVRRYGWAEFVDTFGSLKGMFAAMAGGMLLLALMVPLLGRRGTRVLEALFGVGFGLLAVVTWLQGDPMMAVLLAFGLVGPIRSWRKARPVHETPA